MGTKEKFALFLKKKTSQKDDMDVVTTPEMTKEIDKKAKKEKKVKKEKKEKEVKEVKEVKKGKYKSIKGSMMLAYCIPIVLIVILGTTSYRMASKVVIEKYETSVASTMNATARYLDIVCTEMRNKASSLATDKKLYKFFTSLYKNNDTESKTLYNDYYLSLSNYKRTSDFLSDYYVIADTGIPLLSDEKTEAMRRTIRENAFLEFWDQEDATAFADDSVQNAWVGYHPFIDTEFLGDQSKYAVSYIQAFPHKDGVVILDMGLDNIKDTLADMNLGEGSYTALVIPGQREVIVNQTLDKDTLTSNLLEDGTMIFSNQTFFSDTLDATETVTSQVRYEGKDYFFVNVPIPETNLKLCTLIPLSNLKNEVNGIRNLTVVFMIIGCVIALLCGTYIATGISKVLNRVCKSLTKVSEGDLTQEFKTNRKDELRYLTDALSDTIADIKGLMGEMRVFGHDVKHSAIEVADSSNFICGSMQNVSASLQEVNKGVISQATETENCAKKMLEFSDIMDGVTVSTKAMNQTVDKTIEATRKGQDSIEKLNEKSEATTQIVEQLLNEIQVVVTQSNQIGGIIDAISAIAGQTSLLSLNASIEAARAGNQGRGFAVVAEEIRKLADQSKKAGDEIYVILNQIRATTQNASVSARKTNVFLDEQTTVLSETTQMFTEIKDCVGEMAEGLGTISKNLEEMIEDKDKVSDSMSYISSISEEAAASTREVTDAIQTQLDLVEKLAYEAGSLSEKAQELDVKMKRFKV